MARSYKGNSHIGLGAHPTPVWSHLNFTNYITMTLFPNELVSEVLRVRSLTYLFLRERGDQRRTQHHVTDEGNQSQTIKRGIAGN